MTLEELLDCDASKLEAMSDAELLAHFEPYLKVTRPEQSNPNREKKNYQQQTFGNYTKSNDYKNKVAMANELAAKLGIKLNLK